MTRLLPTDENIETFAAVVVKWIRPLSLVRNEAFDESFAHPTEWTGPPPSKTSVETDNSSADTATETATETVTETKTATATSSDGCVE